MQYFMRANTAPSLSLYCLVDGDDALRTWSGIDRAEVISFPQSLPNWTSLVNWPSSTLVFSERVFYGLVAEGRKAKAIKSTLQVLRVLVIT